MRTVVTGKYKLPFLTSQTWKEKRKTGKLTFTVHRIQCRVDRVWERRDKFSQAQLRKWDLAQQRHKTIEVTCLRHSPGGVQELRCDSCGQVKELSFFSKASRKVSGRHECRDCIDWTEADQVGGRPLPMPGGQRDEGEWDLAQAAREEKENLPKMDDLKIGDNTAAETQSVCLDEETVKGMGSNLHPGLTMKNLNKFLKANQSAVTTDSASTARYHPSSAPSDSLSTIGPMSANGRPTGRNQDRPQYQAIGPNGAVQMRTQSTINASDTASTITTNQTTVNRGGGGGFAKPPTRKTNPDPPNYIIREGPESRVEQAYDSDLSDDAP